MYFMIKKCFIFEKYVRVKMEIYNVKITLSEVQSRKRAKDGGSAL